ncbi:MAG: hypothetical protein FJZ16_08665, partial [Candidatus Omnitrophica bacterium]|nr:hypothetical protein [Candidatus Omnitrophota bacterium]
MGKGYKKFWRILVTVLVSFNLVISPTFFDRADAGATTGLEKSKLAPPLVTGRQVSPARKDAIAGLPAGNQATQAIAGLPAGTPVEIGRIRTALTVPEGQPKDFFTNDYHGYVLTSLLKEPLEKVPNVVLNAIKKKLKKDIKEGR